MILSECPLLPVLSRAPAELVLPTGSPCVPASEPPRLSRAVGYERTSQLFVAPADNCAASFSASLNRAGTSVRGGKRLWLAEASSPPGEEAAEASSPSGGKDDATGDGVAGETLLSDRVINPSGVARGPLSWLSV